MQLLGLNFDLYNAHISENFAESLNPADNRSYFLKRMKISRKDVQYVAGLANLELTDDEQARMEKDLNSILEYIDQLSQLDTANVEPMAQVMQAALASDVTDSLRDDELRECLPHTAALENAPQTDGAFFRVPKVIER